MLSSRSQLIVLEGVVGQIQSQVDQSSAVLWNSRERETEFSSFIYFFFDWADGEEEKKFLCFGAFFDRPSSLELKKWLIDQIIEL